MPIDFEKLKSECHGRWSGIFDYLGVDVGTGKHKPCPSCGGDDRFRFDGALNNGSYICNQCGAGDGFSLLMKVFSWEFTQCIKQVGKAVGMVPENNNKEHKQVDPAIALRHLYTTSHKMVPGDQASKYLMGRGLVLTPNDIMFCPKCYESDTKAKIPAMIAIIKNKSGDAIGMHRTYLNGNKKAEIPSPKKMMPPKSPLNGCAVRLFDPKDKMFESGRLGVAEGIETAMAATQLSGIATWACLSTSLLESFEPPEGIKEIVIFGDCDANFSGQKSAYMLANKLYLKDYLVEVEIPKSGDYNDELDRLTDRPNERGIG